MDLTYTKSCAHNSIFYGLAKSVSTSPISIALHISHMYLLRYQAQTTKSKMTMQCCQLSWHSEHCICHDLPISQVTLLPNN